MSLLMISLPFIIVGVGGPPLRGRFGDAGCELKGLCFDNFFFGVPLGVLLPDPMLF